MESQVETKIQTPFQARKEERDRKIVAMYNGLKGMRSAVVAIVAEEFDVTTDTVYKVLKAYREKIDEEPVNQ